MFGSGWFDILGLDKDRSKPGFAIEEMEFQNPRFFSSSVLLQVGFGLVFGGLICKDRSGWAGNNSILVAKQAPFFFFLFFVQDFLVFGLKDEKRCFGTLMIWVLDF